MYTFRPFIIIFAAVLVFGSVSCSRSGAMDYDAIEGRLQDAAIAEMLLDEEVADHQREILADGFVDPSELEVAGRKTEQCLAENGLSMTFRLSPSGDDYSFSAHYPEGKATLDPVELMEFEDNIFRACEDKNFWAVASKFAWQQRLPAEIRDTVNQAFESCVDSLGEIDGSDEWLSREADCWDDAQEIR